MLHRLLVWLSLLTITSVLSFAQVKAFLVSEVEAAQPGKPFKVALRLVHEPHWHTYWIHAGTGYPTAISWTLPEGWSAGPIEWPTPIVIKDSRGTVVGNGYEGEILLPVTITPNANTPIGQPAKLVAKAEWLMCADACVPGEATLETTINVAAEARANSRWAEKIAALPMPKAPEAWNIKAQRIGNEIHLLLTPRSDAAKPLTSPHFFAEDGFIQYDQPQRVEPTGNGQKLVLPISESAEANTQRLVGVLSTQQPFAGLSINVPIEQAAAVATAATSKTANVPTQSLGALLALALLGGLILNLMPCVFPVLGIKILGFVNQAGAERSKVVMHGITFTLGVLASFWALAGVLAVLRAGGAELGWGFQLQSPPFVFGLAVVMLVFALSMSGVFEFGLSATGVGANLQAKSGYAGSFFTGVLATVVATPCSAPFLAPVLGAALALPTASSFALFTAIAIGLSAPYLLLSIFPQAVRMLPRPGAWMETFKQVMAFPLYATVVFLVWVLAGQTSENGLLMVLIGLTVVAMGIWWYGRFTAPGSKPVRTRIGWFGAALLITGGVALGWPRNPAANEIVWEAWSVERVAALRAQGRPIYVDFTARWCATCQTNKKLVFSSEEVLRAFREKNVATLKADWTNRDPKITAELAKWGRSAVPFNLLYLPDRDEPTVLPELLSPDTVLRALR
jgi:thiol:disulfide interchange protein